MSMEAGTIGRERVFGLGQVPAAFWLAICAYALLFVNGNVLLRDSDTYWQILVGRWILDHHAMPRVDLYSFTKIGEPWMSSSWLSQVLYARAYDVAGWSGPVALAASASAVTFALLAHVLTRRLPQTYALVAALTALVLSMDHLLARPHVLALPVMVVWASGLVAASDRGEGPSFWLLPLIALWANLHGGFVFGLVLLGAFALDALWNTAPAHRKSVFLRWAAFGLAALAACCVTPYGWGSILAARKILDLGELLHMIAEWTPANFSRLSPFEVSILALIGAALYGGVRLSPPRIALVLGLLHMALSHVRNIEIFALLLPIAVMTPVASQFALGPARALRTAFPLLRAAALVLVVGVSTWAFAASRQFAPPGVQSPAAAVDVLKARRPTRVLNDLPFGGYLIWRQIPVFVDGRAELYGEKFELDYYNALQLKDVGLFFDLLKRYDIDAVLLRPSTPAARLLDRLAGWQRAYADDHAVLHVRTSDASPGMIDHGTSR
jgi:hypothetical protein